MFKRLAVPILVLGTALMALNPSKALAERHERRAFAPRQFHERRMVIVPRSHHVRPYFRSHYMPYAPYDYYWYSDPLGYYDAWGLWHPYDW